MRLPNALILAAAVAAGPASAATPVQVSDGCRVVRYTADGRRTETPPKARTGRGGLPGAASAATAASSGRSQARSTVRASSSSRGGRSSALSTATAVDADGRAITTTHDSKGCTVVIDERGARGGHR